MKLKFLIPLALLSGSIFAEAPSISGCVPRVTKAFYILDENIPDNNSASPSVFTIDPRELGNSSNPISFPNEKIIDVDFSTSINNHQFSSDLEVALISPSGTEVIMTYRNGSDKNNIYTGVDFDDQANRNLSTQTFADNVSLGLVNPQQPLSKFAGEFAVGANPWKIKIIDWVGGDTGGILDGILTVTTCTKSYGTSSEMTASSAAPVAITDDNVAVKSNITVDNNISSLCSLEVATNISHPQTNQIKLSLISPQGLEIMLADRPTGGSNTFQSVVWSDYSNSVIKSKPFSNSPTGPYASLAPSQALASFYGIDPNGTWTLKAIDTHAGTTGTIDSWTLKMKGCGKDSDLDGSADVYEVCPNNPAKTDPGVCGCSVADSDTNGNGVIDCKLSSETKKMIADIKALLIKLPGQTSAQKAVTVAQIKVKVLLLRNYVKTSAVKIKSGSSKTEVLAKIESAKTALGRSISSSRISSLSKALSALTAILLAD